MQFAKLLPCTHLSLCSSYYLFKIETAKSFILVILLVSYCDMQMYLRR